MNRSWITALTLATVAGTGCAFAGVVANSSDATTVAAQSPAPFSDAGFVRVEPGTPATRMVTYQVGAAGTATLAIANGALVVNSAAPGSGWGITNVSGPGTHIDVQFTDGTQLVTFGADLVGSDLAVTVTNAPAVPASIAAVAPTTTGVVQPTTPATTALPVAPSTTPPTAAPRPVVVVTTAPPSGGDDGTGDDHEHETEPNDD